METLLMRCEIVQPLWKMVVSLEVKHKFTNWPSRSTHRYLFKRNKDIGAKTCIWTFIAVEKQKQPQMSIKGWTDKEDVILYIHIAMEYYSVLQKWKKSPLLWQHGEHYAKWNKPDTERQILHDLIYMWNFKWSNSYEQKVE